jgi:nicotinamide mononucleotide transporter
MMGTLMEPALQWISVHYIEIIATLAGFLYIFYTIRENTLLWLFGNISSALFAWVFFQSRIYAYAGLYVYYVIIGFYGWYHWWKHNHNDTEILQIRRASPAVLLACTATSLLVSVPVFMALRYFRESDIAWLDALLTGSGMVATWMLTQKYIEQWLFWIVIDTLSLALVIYKGLYPSAFLFAAYTILAVKGYFEWKKKLRVLPLP